MCAHEKEQTYTYMYNPAQKFNLLYSYASLSIVTYFLHLPSKRTYLLIIYTNHTSFLSLFRNNVQNLFYFFISTFLTPIFICHLHNTSFAQKSKAIMIYLKKNYFLTKFFFINLTKFPLIKLNKLFFIF